MTFDFSSAFPPPKIREVEEDAANSSIIITLAAINAARYYCLMIRSFKCSETEKIFEREYSRKFPQAIQRIAMRKLWILDAAINLSELRVPPGNHLEALRGKRKGQHSIRINRQWRICFQWRAGDAYEVEIVDYH